MKSKEEIIELTRLYVQNELQEAERGHDFFHILRVYRTALYIAKKEAADLYIIALGALLHDIADAKFHKGNEEIAPAKARHFLESIEVDPVVIDHIEHIIRNISYKNTLDKSTTTFHSKELEVLQDADRLDAMGAIGIARAFHYGGYKNRLIYDPDIPPLSSQDKETYKNSTAPTINHFYEKLLLLKDLMNTPTGKALAKQRHGFMLDFLEQFYREWEGKS